VEAVAVSRATAAQDVQLALYAEAKRAGHDRGDFSMPKVLAGPDAVAEVAGWPCDVVLNGITGSVGLTATLVALKAGRTLALANKESLIAGGPLVVPYLDQIIPVDSEHSAIAQCLRSGTRAEVRRLVLTASGGPFRGRRRDELTEVTPAEAMAHPTWDMGPVITINSATLVNKGLELIEAHLLFGVPYEQIDVVVHPQSLVHSMVEFTDGSTIAQLSPPDMRLPIALALGWPDRVPGAAAGMDWTRAQDLTFEPLDTVAFPAVGLAKEAGRLGGSGPAVFNAANEEAVAAFVAGDLPFLGIVDVLSRTLERVALRELLTPADVLESEGEARAVAKEFIQSFVREA
jgi:1-deoxy-D-xylulose-5-phosphate reductoisomerase